MVRTKVTVGIALVVALGALLMLYVYRGLDQVAGHLARLEEVEAPFSIAAIEMEKNAGEYALGVLRYIAYPLAETRTEAENDRDDFKRYHATYMRLSTSEQKRELGRHLAEDHARLVEIGTALMDRRDALDHTFGQVTDQLEQMDAIFDHQMEPGAPAQEPLRSRALAAVANMEAEAAEIGFWLAVFQRRPDATARQRLGEKLVELDEALAGYRALPLGAAAARQADAIEALQAQVRRGIDELLAGEDAIATMVSEFVKLQAHIDHVSDEEIEPLAARGLTDPQEQADRITVGVLRTLRYALPLYVLLALAVGVLLVLAIARPLRRLARGTRAIGAGELDHRIEVRGHDEFDDLARQFNRMVERLQESTVSRERLEASEHKLRRTVAELRDEITERQQAEQARERLQAELRRSEAMAAMGALMAGVAHEVRNPLFGISSTLDAMEADAAGAGALPDRYRPVLRREVNRLSKLMRDLLEYGRPPSEEFTPGRLVRIVAEAVHACTAGAEAAGVRLDNRSAACDVTLAVNHGRLVQVFVNLIENALQHAPAGSAITVEAQRLPDGADGRSWVEVQVLDRGPGFDPDALAHAFEPFFTRRRRGTGLGLAIVQRIVDEHRGTVAVANREGGGAAVTVRLPLGD